MSASTSNGALWHSGEHRVPALGPAERGGAARRAAVVEVASLYRELGRWKTRAAELERRLAVAETQALSTQLTPHFLCNSLQAVSALLHRDPRAADAMIIALSELLRLVLRSAAVPEGPLAGELALVERYVDVMRFRFGGGLRLVTDVAREARDALVPHLLLQPLVENAILHGFGARPGEIRVIARRRGEMLHCTVADDGRGLPPGPLVEGIGLAGTRGRLRGMYGARHSLELAENEAGGMTVTVTLPYRVAGEAPEGEP